MGRGSGGLERSGGQVLPWGAPKERARHDFVYRSYKQSDRYGTVRYLQKCQGQQITNLKKEYGSVKKFSYYCAYCREKLLFLYNFRINFSTHLCKKREACKLSRKYENVCLVAIKELLKTCRLLYHLFGTGEFLPFGQEEITLFPETAWGRWGRLHNSTEFT